VKAKIPTVSRSVLGDRAATMRFIDEPALLGDDLLGGAPTGLAVSFAYLEPGEA
jgi:hypothetical protein